MSEREALSAEKAEAEEKIEALYKEQRELRDKITKIIHEQIPRLERESANRLREGQDWEEINDEINKLKRSTRSMDVFIGKKTEEMDRLRRKIEVLEGELAKLPEEPEPEPVKATDNKERRT